MATPIIPQNELLWLLPVTIWELAWKGFALWKAADKKRMYWFIAMLVLNTAGILPIIYIFFVHKRLKPMKSKMAQASGLDSEENEDKK